MTKVDERAVVPPVAEAARARLAGALDRPGIVAAYLFGSQARGTAGPLSDIDIAVRLEPGLDSGPAFKCQVELMRICSEVLHTDEVQVVILNEATPLLRHRAIRDGIRLVDRDPLARIRLETQAVRPPFNACSIRKSGPETPEPAPPSPRSRRSPAATAPVAGRVPSRG